MANRTKLDLRTLIRTKYKTYEELGQEVGLTKSGVSEVVNGRNRRPTTLYAIAAALGHDPDDIDWPSPEAA